MSRISVHFSINNFAFIRSGLARNKFLAGINLDTTA
jgi:hypothetical protein